MATLADSGSAPATSAGRHLWMSGVFDTNRVLLLAACMRWAMRHPAVHSDEFERVSGDDGYLITGRLSWNDRVAGAVSAAVVLHIDDAERGRWAIVADAEHPWTIEARSPMVVLDLVNPAAGGVLDESLAPAVTECAVFDPTDPEIDQAAPRLAQAITSPARTQGMVLCALSRRQTYDLADNLDVLAWPGVCGVFIIPPAMLPDLNAILPAEQQLSAGGGRYWPPPGQGDPVELRRMDLRPGTLSQLARRVLADRVAAAPSPFAVIAAGLLAAPIDKPAADGNHPFDAWAPATNPPPTTLDVTVPPPSPDPADDQPAPDPADRAREEARLQLREAHTQLALARIQVGRLAEQRDHAVSRAETAEAHLAALAADGILDAGQEIAALRKQLDAAMDHADELLRRAEQAERDRDQALQVLGTLNAPRQSDPADEQAPAEPVVASTFAAVIAEAVTSSDGLLDATFCDLNDATALDGHPKAAGWRRKVADALSTMTAYARARRDDPAAGPHLRDLLAFVHTGSAGVRISARLVALSESDVTDANPRYRAARTFRVHPDTSPDGQAYFPAHIKIDAVPPAPRLHFLDDLAGTGRIYIGSCSEHKISSRTN